MSVNVAFYFHVPSGLGLIHSRGNRGDLPVPHSPAALPGESMPVSQPGLISHTSSSLKALSWPLKVSSPVAGGCLGEESEVHCPTSRRMTCFDL